MEIEVGKKYEVEIQDCCVMGYFKATLTKIEGEVKKANIEGNPLWLIFDNGVKIAFYGNVTLTEISEEEDEKE